MDTNGIVLVLTIIISGLVFYAVISLRAGFKLSQLQLVATENALKSLKSLTAEVEAIPRQPKMDLDALDAKFTEGLKPLQTWSIHQDQVLNTIQLRFENIVEKVENTVSSNSNQLILARENSMQDRNEHFSQIRIATERLEKTNRDLIQSANANSEVLNQIGLGLQRDMVQGVDALKHNAKESLDAIQMLRAEAQASLRASSEQAEKWLTELSNTSKKLPEILEGAQHFSDASAQHQTELNAAIEMLNQGLGGMLDRLQSHATVIEGQQGMVGKMESTLHNFESRAAEMLEENALKSQEALLEALARLDANRSEELSKKDGTNAN